MSQSTNKMLALWAIPRSTSTAFEWMMRERGDFTCFHEPFGEVWYQGDAPDWPRYRPGSVRTPGLTYQSRWDEVVAASSKGSVFVKDFPLYLSRMWSESFFDNFTHSFLIRHPAKSISSLYKQWPDFEVIETGFAEQRQLFDELTDRTGRPPPVIDSDDLLEAPNEIVAAWCAAVGIPYLAEALSWAPGERAEVSWWDGGVFHQNLRESDGLKPQIKSAADPDNASPRVRAAVDEVLPHYLALYQHRLRV